MADGVTVEAQGIKEISQMFNGLPKRVNKDAVWGRFWEKVTVPLLEAAERNAPIAKEDVPYPPDSTKKNKKRYIKKIYSILQNQSIKGRCARRIYWSKSKGKIQEK